MECFRLWFWVSLFCEWKKKNLVKITNKTQPKMVSNWVQKWKFGSMTKHLWETPIDLTTSIKRKFKFCVFSLFWNKRTPNKLSDHWWMKNCNIWALLQNRMPNLINRLIRTGNGYQNRFFGIVCREISLMIIFWNCCFLSSYSHLRKCEAEIEKIVTIFPIQWIYKFTKDSYHEIHNKKKISLNDTEKEKLSPKFDQNRNHINFQANNFDCLQCLMKLH